MPTDLWHQGAVKSSTCRSTTAFPKRGGGGEGGGEGRPLPGTRPAPSSRPLEAQHAAGRSAGCPERHATGSGPALLALPQHPNSAASCTSRGAGDAAVAAEGPPDMGPVATPLPGAEPLTRPGTHLLHGRDRPPLLAARSGAPPPPASRSRAGGHVGPGRALPPHQLHAEEQQHRPSGSAGFPAAPELRARPQGGGDPPPPAPAPPPPRLARPPPGPAPAPQLREAAPAAGAGSETSGRRDRGRSGSWDVVLGSHGVPGLKGKGA